MKNQKRKQQSEISWCLKKGIKIYPVPLNNNSLVIEIDDNGKKIRGKIVFSSKGFEKDKDNWWNVIPSLYTKLYKKYNNEVH
jgi:hypothetical protein